MRGSALLMVGLGALFFAGASDAASALEPETREAIVLHDRVWEGFSYVENFVPSETEDVLLLADADNALRYVKTLEYFWPLSREVYVAFDTLREELPGELVISQNGVAVAEIGLDDYTIVYPEGMLGGHSRMVWGEEARKAFRDFKRAMADYNRAFAEAQRDRSRYLRELREAAEARVKNGETRTVVPPIPEPDPVLGSATEPRSAFRVSLPAGVYEIVLRSDGQAVPETRKTLRVIPVSSTSEVTADVIPEERWTRVLSSNQPSDRVFVGEGKTFYLTLTRSNRFDEAAYARLTRPQALATSGRETWIRREPHDADTIEISWDGGDFVPVARSDFKAEQTQGRNLGYVIRPAAEGERPDLSAFPVAVPLDRAASRAVLRLPAADGADTDWTREIIVVRESPPILVWGTALVPAAFGVGLAALRRVRRHAGRTTKRSQARS